jgi:hypothetical protein
MSAKYISVVLAVLSALGVVYVAGGILLGLGDFAWVVANELNILLVALVVTLVPAAATWGGIWWVHSAKSVQGYVGRLLASSAFAWAWLFFGSIYLAVLRFQ